MARSFVVLLALLVGCDPPRPPDDAPAQPRAVEPPARPPVVAQPVRGTALTVTLTAIRRSGDAVEIEIALDRKLPPTGGSRPTLQIGERSFTRSRRADGQLDRLVFLLSAAELDALPDGAPLVVRDRAFTSAAMASPPVLDKSSVVVTP